MTYLPRQVGSYFLLCFVTFNILLAMFNMFTFRVSFQQSKPCSAVYMFPSTPVAIFAGGSLSSFNHTLPPVKNSSSVAEYKLETEVRGNYVIIKNYLRAELSPGVNESVTLTTQATLSFLHHAEPLCKCWDGPISLAVYAPSSDLLIVIDRILQMIQCGHLCVKRNITWHLIYDTQFPPENDLKKLRTKIFDCEAHDKTPSLKTSFRKSHSLTYPINIARNVARQNSATYFIMASDIELYPSLNIVSRFLNMIAKMGKDAYNKKVYVLPIFEVSKSVKSPTTKTELLNLIKQKKAVFFHKFICDICQHFPGRDQWLKQVPANNTLNIFTTTKRQHPLTSWEPIYIGTNKEPFYDERLTWEGKQDKMSQMYEMCLLDYDICILDNAFLVHAPGIKTIKNMDQKKRLPYIRKNNAIHKEVLKNLKEKYEDNPKC
ncbi:beta-1,4-glucuronyltransferase 1-like [Tachypleus tridentatus]|uniref:beta-1,4-glucuronyltransferase 1-like n=1 Tax=Tachypleus tridentatus TaxID=6853 RepID=UPI003FD18FD5